LDRFFQSDFSRLLGGEREVPARRTRTRTGPSRTPPLSDSSTTTYPTPERASARTVAESARAGIRGGSRSNRLWTHPGADLPLRAKRESATRVCMACLPVPSHLAQRRLPLHQGQFCVPEPSSLANSRSALPTTLSTHKACEGDIPLCSADMGSFGGALRDDKGRTGHEASLSVVAV